MNCPQCKNLMVKTKATAFGEEYDYCRTCKKELKEIKVEESVFSALGKLKYPSVQPVDLPGAIFEENDLVTTPRYSNLVFQIVKVYPSYANGYVLECTCNGNIYMLDSFECTIIGKMATIYP